MTRVRPEEAEWFETNRAAWNAWTPLHARSAFYDVDGFLAGRCSLNAIELELVGNVAGASLLHLQCHFGQDTLSWARRGARVTGVDFSEVAIAEARRLEDTLRLGARFVVCNVYDTLAHVEERFDVVFTSYGTIGWLPDLERWADVVAGALKPGGRFHLVEFHPALWMLDNDGQTVRHPYHNVAPIEEIAEGSYADRNAAVRVREVGWNHALSEVFGVLLRRGLTVARFDEYPYAPYSCVPDAVRGIDGMWRIRGEEKVPLVYALTMTR
ncbi:MAG: class I SAM-dependent methyltransferase [Myxococcota bacterium]